MAFVVNKADDVNPITRTTFAYRDEAEEAKRRRMQRNKNNYDCYHLRQDHSEKLKGQSKEFLPKQQLAVDQMAAFMEQGLIDHGKWFSIEREPGVLEEDQLFKPEEIEKLLLRQLEKTKIHEKVSDGVKTAELASLMIAKIGGEIIKKPSFKFRKAEDGVGAFGKDKLTRIDKRVWQLRIDLVRPEDWYPDDTARGLYEGQRIQMDRHELLALARQNPDTYDLEAVEQVGTSDESFQRHRRSTETDQVAASKGIRKPITFWEFQGTLLDSSTGEIMENEEVGVLENVIWAVSDDGKVIRPPKKNDFWHGGSQYVVAPIIRVPFSVWHRAVMDAPTMHNWSINDLYNLMFDSGMASVFGIKQLREDWLEDTDQIADGIFHGTTLKVKESVPVGGKVVERVDTGSLGGNEALNMFNIADNEFKAAAMTSDVRQGNLPERAVKSTEIIASQQAITGIFKGITKAIEQSWMVPILQKSWQVMLQFMQDLDDPEVEALIGKERARFLANTTKEQRFAKSALGNKYKVFGLSQTLNKIQDFQKLGTLLQTVAANEALVEAFQRKFSFVQLLDQIFTSLDIDPTKLQISDAEKQQIEQERQRKQAESIELAGAKKAGGGDQGSQVPGMQNTTPNETGLEPPRRTSNAIVGQPG